jgi:hypothetical protein
MAGRQNSFATAIYETTLILFVVLESEVLDCLSVNTVYV